MPCAAFLHCGLRLTLQKNPETESVRDEKQGHDESRNEIGGTQLPGDESGMIGLIEGVEKIGCTPDIKDPGDSNAHTTGQRYQCKQSEYRRN